MSERERAAGTWINKLKREMNNVRVGYFHPIIGGLEAAKTPDPYFTHKGRYSVQVCLAEGFATGKIFEKTKYFYLKALPVSKNLRKGRGPFGGIGLGKGFRAILIINLIFI